MNTLWFPIIALAILTIVGLSSYAMYLHLKLRTQTTEREKKEQTLSEELAGRREHYRNSVRVICSAIVEEQVSLTEGAIRISMLVSQLELTEQEKVDFQAFFQLTQATSHIPILEEWKDLSKKEKLSFDQEREKLEESFKTFIEDSARRVLDGSVTAAGKSFVGDASALHDSQYKPKTELDETLYYSVGNDQKNNQD